MTDNEQIKELMEENAKLLAEIAEYREVLKPIAETAEWASEPNESRACGIGCDLGAAGYSTLGPGYHDDICKLEKAREVLERYPEREGVMYRKKA